MDKEASDIAVSILEGRIPFQTVDLLPIPYEYKIRASFVGLLSALKHWKGPNMKGIKAVIDTASRGNSDLRWLAKSRLLTKL